MNKDDKLIYEAYSTDDQLLEEKYTVIDWVKTLICGLGIVCITGAAGMTALVGMNHYVYVRGGGAERDRDQKLPWPQTDTTASDADNTPEELKNKWRERIQGTLELPSPQNADTELDKALLSNTNSIKQLQSNPDTFDRFTKGIEDTLIDHDGDRNWDGWSQAIDELLRN
tara:strand:+ start:786 stop:1295 length:510 start_codon:yes stop_codon:yes gene_type:complete